MSGVEISFTAVAVLVSLALLFDFMNGFHDAANSIATIVSTRVLKPHQAVIWAAVFNVLAYFIFELKVASTIGKGTIDAAIVDHFVVFGALIGAIIWNVITWYYGIPSSSSHALVGGLVGAAVAKSGPGALIWGGVGKIVAFIFIAPLLGFLAGGLLMVAVSWACNRTSPTKVDRLFRRLQLFSAAAHGGITGVPGWVVAACYAAMGLGTMFGGWRIVKTMGQKITKLNQPKGFAANSAGAMTLFLATGLGIPVSTTHTITGAIMGVGATGGVKKVRWTVAGGIVWAWVLTIPATALISAAAWWIGELIL